MIPSRKEVVSDPKLNWRQPGYPRTQDDDEPVVQVSWNDAMAFCDGSRTGRSGLIACPRRPSGNTRAGRAARPAGASGDSPEELESLRLDAEQRQPHDPPGRHASSPTPSACSICMATSGNGAWITTASTGPDRRSNPKGPPAGKTRVLRGGALGPEEDPAYDLGVSSRRQADVPILHLWLPRLPAV